MIDLVSKNKDEGAIPLNKRVAQAGVCARRKAATLVESGVVRVNGIIVKDPGFRVTPTDVVAYQKRALHADKYIYLILNKPRKVVTTVADEQDRKTVIDLLPADIGSRVYPVGRLDKDTTGLLLLTNDGDLAQQLAHPKYRVQKTYNVTLDRPINETMMARIRKGIVIEDGKVFVDEIAYTSPHELNQLRVVLHSGKNKIVRRLFKQCGFWVKKLDRPLYAGLSTKGLERGGWRRLTAYEISALRRKVKPSKSAPMPTKEPVNKAVHD
jgi:23S rRNA pseudouridine2605 synthase